MILSSLLLSLALAAEGVDATGALTPPREGDATQSVYAWQPGGVTGGTATVGLRAGWATGLLVRELVGAGDTLEQRLLGSATGLELGAAYAVHDRVSVGLTAPVWLATTGDTGGGPALGDVHLWAPVRLVSTDGGLSVGVLPWVDLPTGNASRLVGDTVVHAGALAAVGLDAGPLAVALNAGLEVAGDPEFEQLQPGSSAVFAGAAGVRVTDGLAVGAELRGRAFLGDSPYQSPVEALLSGRGTLPAGLSWHAGVGTGLSRGIGAPSVRAMAGVQWSFGGAEDGLDVDPVAVAPAFTLHVVDPAATPVQGAEVLVRDEVVGVTDAAGVLAFDKEPRWRTGVRVRSDGYFERTVEDPGGAAEKVVTLAWEPIPVSLRVQDAQGQAVDARVHAQGSSEVPEVPVGEDGVWRAELPPGDWVLRVTADGFGAQERTLQLDPDTDGGDALAEVLHEGDVILAPAQEGGSAGVVLRLVDEDGAPVPAARVLVDGLPVGTTASGGSLALLGLVEGEHRVEISADTFETVEQYTVDLSAGRQERALVMERTVGTVRVVARGPEGIVPDAVVRFFGASRLPPTPLGEDGERTVVVRPGTWSVLVTAAHFGLQERSIVVPEDDNRVLLVDVVLQPAEEGQAELEVLVVDPDGAPVPGAELSLDDRELGTTSSGGTFRLGELATGPRTLAVRAEHFREQPPAELFLVEGAQEQVVVLDWEAGTTRVRATSPVGQVRDAYARFSGPAPHDKLALDPHGEAWTVLDPGPWQVLVVSPEHGMQQRSVAVEPDSRRLNEVGVVLEPSTDGVAQLDLSVVGPAGGPVDGAEVLLDGVSLGATSSGGGLSARQLLEGGHRVVVRSELYQEAALDVDLDDGVTAEQVALAWATGATRVRVVGADGPVPDASLRFMGPSGRRAPVRVDASGTRTVRLEPGSWDLLVAAPDLALAQHRVVVPEAPGLQEVEVVLEPVGAGVVELVLRARDEDGGPVAGATVRVGGAEAGVTGPGGACLLTDLAPGPLELRLEAPGRVAAAPEAFDLREGRTERTLTLPWQPVPLAVVVRDTDGQPVDAVVRFDGPADHAPGSTGAGGEASFALRPGTWTVLASTDALGVRSAVVELAPGQEQAQVELVLESARVDVTDVQVVLREAVHFEFDQATVRPDSASILDEVAATLLARPDLIRVQVQGHTDNKGGVAYNLELSQRRAEAVVAALVSRGVAPERLVAVGYGSTRPVGTNDTEEGQAANRRVQFDVERE